MKLVSIIIPFYNPGKFIIDAIDSVLSQTYVNWELLLIDDGSTDSTHIIIEKYLDNPKIRYYKKNNGGQGSARNLGIINSKGNYIAFLDADDIWISEKLDRQIIYFENDVDLVFSNAQVIDTDNIVKKEKLNPGNGFYANKIGFVELICGGFFIPTSTCVCKKSLLVEAGNFSDDRYDLGAEDFDLWCRMFLNDLNTYGLTDVTTYYRKHPSQFSTNDLSNSEGVIKSLLEIKSKKLVEDFMINFGLVNRIRSFYKIDRHSNKLKSIDFIKQCFPQRKYLNKILINNVGLFFYLNLIYFFSFCKKKIYVSINNI